MKVWILSLTSPLRGDEWIAFRDRFWDLKAGLLIWSHDHNTMRYKDATKQLLNNYKMAIKPAISGITNSVVCFGIAETDAQLFILAMYGTLYYVDVDEQFINDCWSILELGNANGDLGYKDVVHCIWIDEFRRQNKRLPENKWQYRSGKQKMTI